MQYTGKLYGKFAGKYIPLTHTTEDIDKMDTLDKLKAELNETKEALQDLLTVCKSLKIDNAETENAKRVLTQ